MVHQCDYFIEIEFINFFCVGFIINLKRKKVIPTWNFQVVFVCEKRDSKVMKILAPVRSQFDNLGIYSSHKFTLKSSFFFVSTLSCFVLATIFLFFEANTLTKYAESFYGAATALFIFSINVIHVWKRKCVFELMDITEDLIEKRKALIF